MVERVQLAGFIPFDPVTDRYFVNAIGNSAAEASINVTCIEMDAEVEMRLKYLPVEIRPAAKDEA